MNKLIKLGFLALFALVVSNVNAQDSTYFMASGLVLECSGQFRDSGVDDPSAGTSFYSENENITQTFCPETGTFLIFDFSSMSLGAGDTLWVYDGNTTASPLLDMFTSTSVFSGLIYSTNASNTTGCITYEFRSDADTATLGEGWLAEISCTPPCQNMFVQVIAIDPDTTGPNGEMDVCLGDTGTWDVSGLYPMNNIWYNQSPSNVTFEWSLENSANDTLDFGVGTNFQTTFDTVGALFLNIQMTDINGCNEVIPYSQLVRVAGRPDFSGTNASTDSACYGVPFDLNGDVEPFGTSTYIPPVSGDSLNLPDNVNQPFTSILTISSFPATQTVTTVNDIQDVWMNIEHCYIGDLSIDLTCPNGSTVLLKSFPGGGGDWLGIPCDNGLLLPIGTTFPYQWMPAGNTFGTMNAVAGAFPCTGCLATAAPCTPNNTFGQPWSLDSSSYDPVTALSNFVGCPINGNWTLTIVDNLGIDNGFIESWGVNFAQNILPIDSIEYTVGIDSTYWSVNSLHSTQTGTGDTVSAIGNLFDTTLTYEYNVVDSFGCSHVDTVEVFIKSPCDPSCAANITPAMGQFPAACIGDSTGQAWAIPADSISPGPYDFYWRDNAGDTIAIHFQVPGTDTLSNLGAAPYSVAIVDSFGCETVGFITVQNVAPILLTINNSTQTSCAGTACDASATGQVISGGTAPFIFLWDNGGFQQTDTNLCVGERYVVAVDSRGCTDTARVTISEPDSISVQAFGEDTICISNTQLLSAIATGGNGGYIYKWNKNLPDGSPTPASPTITQTYTVSATDVNNCPIDTASVTVYVRGPLFAEILPIDTICPGDNITIAARASGGDGNFGYSWSSGFSFTDSLTYAPASSEMVYVTVSDACGTSPTVVDSVWVQVGGYPAIQPVIDPTDTSICAGQAYALKANAKGGVRPYSFAWDNGLPGGAVNAVAPTKSTTYRVTISDRCQTPVGVGSIRINIDNFKDFGLDIDSKAKCYPESFTFSTSPYVDNYTYEWDFGAGFTSVGNDFQVSSSFETSGCQDVGVRVTTDNGCVSTKYFDCAVTVYPTPDADFLYDPLNPDIINPQVTFTSLATGNNSQYWYINDDLISDAAVMVHTFQDSGSFSIKLVAENVYCADSAVKRLEVDFRTALWIPTAFTPNGDTRNDVFLPVGEGIQSIEIDVYDRWGVNVFSSNSLTQGWDGRYSNGDKAPIGVYVYRISYILHNGMKEHVQGEINLVR